MIEFFIEKLEKIKKHFLNRANIVKVLEYYPEEKWNIILLLILTNNKEDKTLTKEYLLDKCNSIKNLLEYNMEWQVLHPTLQKKYFNKIKNKKR